MINHRPVSTSFLIGGVRIPQLRHEGPNLLGALGPAREDYCKTQTIYPLTAWNLNGLLTLGVE